jgi:hypothetical protein
MTLALAGASMAVMSLSTAQASTVFNFDDITVSGVTEVDLTNQYAGMTFTGARVLNSPGQLNDVNFPPFTGPNVIANDADGFGGFITITFDAPVTSVGAYATTFDPLTVRAYDGATLLGSATLAVPNYANGGVGQPNQFLSLDFAQITSVQYYDGNFGSFTLDNLTIDGGAFTGVPGVPEPATWAMLLLGFGVMGGTLRARRQRDGIAAAA